MKNTFDLRNFLTENKLTQNSSRVSEDQERDHQFYANKEGAEVIMQLAKDAINLMDEQPGTSPHIALQAVLEDYMEDNDLEETIKEYLEDGGPAADAFREAGLGDSDMVKLKVDNEQTLGPISVSKAVAYVEKKSNNGEMERQYAFDDIEGDGAVLNISIADSITIDVYRA